MRGNKTPNKYEHCVSAFDFHYVPLKRSFLGFDGRDRMKNIFREEFVRRFCINNNMKATKAIESFASH
jgi:hypothetical protein